MPRAMSWRAGEGAGDRKGRAMFNVRAQLGHPSSTEMEILAVSILLVATLVLLVTELIPVDLTALGVMVALMVLRILTPSEALAGFANPAPITIAVLLVVGKGLMRTGALDFITDHMIRLSRGSPNRLLFFSLFLVGGFSSVVNNTPVVVLFTAIIMAVCCEYSLSPSKFLMPISFVSIMAGTSTLIGTSTNIIVSDLAADYGNDPIGMFELSALGIPTAMVGAALLFFLAPRLLGDHKEPVCELKTGDKQRYISELLIPEGSTLVGKDVAAELTRRFPDIELFEVLRGQTLLDPARAPVFVESGDLLLVKATAPQLAQMLSSKCVLLPKGENGLGADPHDTESIVVELLVQPNSDAVGRSLKNLIAGLDAHVRVLGVKRHWQHFATKRMRELRLTVGDIILVQTPTDHLDQLRATGDLLVIEGVHQTIVNRRKAPLAMGIFAAMILVTAVAGVSILVTSMAAMVLMLLTRCLSQREAYRAIDARVLLLIIGTFSLGAALQKTGAADLYAEKFLAPFAGASPHLVLSAFILLTSLLSLFLSNNATAVLLLPIALSTAGSLGVDPRPFIIGLCFGASACYASPIGYQTNLLVYGPGGYRFVDYLKLGIPLNVLVWLSASIFVPIIWPF